MQYVAFHKGYYNHCVNGYYAVYGKYQLRLLPANHNFLTLFSAPFQYRNTQFTVIKFA